MNTLFVSFVAVGLAFVPSIVKWLQTGVWHMNPIYSFTNPFQRLVGAHAISGLLLLALFFVQVFAGVTGSPGSRRRVYHRRIGYFIIAPLMFITLGIATATEVMANLCCQEFGFETTLIATVILICFTLGLRAARQKRIPEHKDWMCWAATTWAARRARALGPGSECISQLLGPGSRITDHRSWTTDHRSGIAIPRSRVTRHG